MPELRLQRDKIPPPVTHEQKCGQTCRKQSFAVMLVCRVQEKNSFPKRN